MEYIVIAIVIIAAFSGISKAIDKPKELARLKENYDNALRGTDKERALRYGRAYYSLLRDGKGPTIYDEQAMANDLSAMKNEKQ